MSTVKKNTKKTTTKKTTKKPVESTGVVDEFLNENIGKVVKETPKTEPKKKTTSKKKETKTDELVMAPYLPVENAETIKIPEGIDIKYVDKEVNPEYYSEFDSENVNEAAKVIYDALFPDTDAKVNEQKEKTPEEKWKDLGLDSETQEDSKAEATKIGVSFDEVKQPKEEENDGKHIIEISEEDYQEIAKMMLQDAEELIDGKEEKKENVENIKIGKKLEPEEKENKPNPLSITFVTSAMGVSYD